MNSEESLPERVREALRSHNAPPPMPEGLWAEIEARERKRQERRPVWPRPTVALAASIVLLLIGGSVGFVAGLANAGSQPAEPAARTGLAVTDADSTIHVVWF